MSSKAQSLKFIQYVRKSSQGESRQVASLEDQEKILRELIAKESLTIVQRLSESQSAKEPGIRPIYQSMLDAIQAGKANAILVWHLDRLSRNPADSGVLQWLLQSGVIKCIKTPEREYHPEDHALLMAVESSMANQYVRDLKRNVYRGVKEKAERGSYPYKAKAGYIVETVTRHHIADLIRFGLLRMAWEDMLTGLYSVPQELERLNAKGYRLPRTKNGGNKPMSRSSLYRLFVDPFYTGVFEFEGRTIQGNHPPLVSKEEFARVQRILGRPLREKPQKYQHPYAGLARCGVCGCQITAETHVKTYKQHGTSRSYTYYHCTGRKGCTKHSVTEADMEGQIKDSLEGCRLDPFFADWAIDVLKREEADQSKLEQITEHTVPEALQTIYRRLDRLYAMREDGEISKEDFLTRKAKHQADLDTLTEASHQATTKTTRDRQTLQNLLTFARDAYTEFTTGSPERKRQVALSFAPSYVLTQGTLTISTHPALDLIRTFEPPKTPDQQIGPGDTDALDSTWRTMLDQLRKVVTCAEQAFSHYICAQHTGHTGSEQ